MLVNNTALVSETTHISSAKLAKVSAALQKQATRDFGPIWDVHATVDAFARLQDVPVGYWPIVVRDDIHQPGAAGVHLDRNGQPFALVQYDQGWALTASHEMLEMLADPFGNRLVAGDSPKPGQGRVEFMVEVADPSEAPEFGYTVNGILLSDFITPKFYDPVAAPDIRYSFNNKLPRPRDIVKGGYISFHDPVSNHWWQKIWFGPKPQFRDLGVMTGAAGSLRAAIDAKTDTARQVTEMTAAAPELQATLAARPKHFESSEARASHLKERIEEIVASGPSYTWEDEGEVIEAEPAE